MLRKIATVCFACLLLGLGGAKSVEPSVDLAIWRHLPVFHHGRAMPLDTFARSAAEIISKQVNPTFRIDGTPADKLKSEEYAGARQLFPDGKPRRFQAPELLLSWLVEPEKWEHVPFLIAEHEELRKLLGVPVTVEEGEHKGEHLKHVSPAEVADSEEFRDRLDELRQKQQQAQSKMEKFTPSGVDQKVKNLFDAYTLYRQLTFNPVEQDGARGRFLEKAAAALRTWGKLDEDLKDLRNASGGKSELDGILTQLDKGMQTLIDVAGAGRFPLSKMEPTVVSLAENADALSEYLGQRKKMLFGDSVPDWPAEQLKNARTQLTRMASGARQVAKQTKEMHLALYDNGEALRITPALNPAALEKDRDAADDSQPWLTLQTVLYGSRQLLAEYPEPRVNAVRATFQKLGAAYMARDAKNRPELVSTALDQFGAAVRKLGVETDAIREKLPIQNRDEGLMLYTSYPAPGATESEVLYNHTDPFKWSWVISLLGALCFSVSFGVARKPMFWAGVGVMIACIAWTIFGFYLRVMVTHWAPVTGMYETVIYVPTFVSLLGLWFVLQPIILPGTSLIWRMTAIPGTWEATPLNEEQTRMLAPSTWNTLGYLMIVPRVLLMSLIFWVLAVKDYAAGGRTIINKLPVVDVGATMPDMNNFVVWLVGMCVLVPTVWYLPRLVLSVLGSVVSVPWTLRRHATEELPAVYARWPFALSSALVAAFLYMVAWYAPILERGFNPLQPVLRDNFWLTIHVLTIVSSYGAGALAWGLGNIALVYYLFGTYRDPAAPVATPGSAKHQPRFEVEPTPAPVDRTRRPPEACASLAAFAYKAMQVAVLLLAAGTILGGLWADVSWGRFWGWDPKEVWALVSLLTYLIILHGRYAGWFGNFGLAVACVMGATSITMSWFGVNFVLGAGLHSYGFGEGGQMEVALGVALNWLLLGAAAVRYLGETRR